MRAEGIRVKLTIPFPYDTPDKNGVVYSKEAVERAVNNLHKGLPILYRGNVEDNNATIIGATCGDTHIVTWDTDKCVCNVTVDGMLFAGGTECTADIENGTVTDFTITGFGISETELRRGD